MQPYPRLYDVCPAYREALDYYELHMNDEEPDPALWDRVVQAARDFRARIIPMRRE